VKRERADFFGGLGRSCTLRRRCNAAERAAVPPLSNASSLGTRRIAWRVASLPASTS